MTDTASRHHTLFLIMAFALLLRVLCITFAAANGGVAVFHALDTADYVTPAFSLFHHGTFSTASGPEIARTPGYPLLLTLGLALGPYEAITIALQIILSLVCVVLVYDIARQAFGSSRVALVAAALFAVEPLSIIYCGRLLPETLFTTLLLLFFAAMLSYFSKPSWMYLVFASVLLVGATLTRPITYYLAPFMALLLLAIPTTLGIRQRLARSAMFVVISLALLFSWQVRNYIVANYWGFSSIQEINLYFYNAAAVQAENRSLSLGRIQRELGFNDEVAYLARHPEQVSWPIGYRLQYLRQEATGVIVSAPLHYTRLHLVGSARVLFGTAAPGTLQMLGLPRPAMRMLTWADAARTSAALVVTAITGYVFVFAYYLLAAVGLSGRLKQPFVMFAAVVVGYLALVSGGVTGYSRFRHPIMPFLCVLAADGLTRILTRLRGIVVGPKI